MEWGVLFILVFFVMTLETRILASNSSAAFVFEEPEYPCAANCGSGSCFSTAWDAAAAQSKIMTLGCTVVLYSVAIDDRAGDFNLIDDYWADSMNCSILFLSAKSLYLREHRNATKVGNWSIVAVDSLADSGFSNARKASRVPKLSPGKFFADCVQYSLYIDSKLELMRSPMILLSTHLDRSRNVSIAMVNNQIRDLTHEIALIKKAKSFRPTVTHNFEAVTHQGELYAGIGITGAGFAVDGALIMTDLRSPAATQYMCMWLNQVLKYGDRDQVSFQGALYYFSHRSNYTVMVEEGGFRHVALDTVHGRHYLRMLPIFKYWWGPPPFGNRSAELARTRNRSWN